MKFLFITIFVFSALFIICFMVKSYHEIQLKELSHKDVSFAQKVSEQFK